jgi:uncharacterized protein
MSEKTTELFILLNSNKLNELRIRLTRENVNVRDEAVGDTLLLDAAARSNADAVRLLLNLGADVDAVSSEGNTPLIVAASRYNQDIAKLLLEAGADPNIKGSKGMTAVRWAITGGPDGYDLVRLLLQHGANPWIANNAGVHTVAFAEKLNPEFAAEIKRIRPRPN